MIPLQRFCIISLAAFGLSQAARAADPTEYEQYMLELINRARANPTAEVARLQAESNTQPGYWGAFTGFNIYDGFVGAASLNEGPPQLGEAAYSIPSAAKQPMAFNTSIIDATRAYVAMMQASNSVAHTLGGTTVTQRLASQGYANELALLSGQNNYFPGAENNSTVATSESFDVARYPGDIRKEAMDVMHHGLFTDGPIPSRGHRMTMMAADWREAGIGLSFGTDGAFSSVYANHDFGHQTGRGPFITGVAYSDGDSDSFYTPEAGESLGGLQVIVMISGTQTSVATTTTFATGGYGVIVPANGTYDVRFVGANIDETISGVAVTTQNVKVDAIDPGFHPIATTSTFAITDIWVDGSNVTISWSSDAGARYRVRYATTLGSWSVIAGSEVTASGAVSSYTDTRGTSGTARRYYQIEKLP